MGISVPLYPLYLSISQTQSCQSQFNLQKFLPNWETRQEGANWQFFCPGREKKVQICLIGPIWRQKVLVFSDLFSQIRARLLTCKIIADFAFFNFWNCAKVLVRIGNKIDLIRRC